MAEHSEPTAPSVATMAAKWRNVGWGEDLWAEFLGDWQQYADHCIAAEKERCATVAGRISDLAAEHIRDARLHEDYLEWHTRASAYPPTGRVELGERSNTDPQPETLETWAAGLSLAEVARIETEAFLRGRVVGEKYGPQITEAATLPSPPAVVDYTERSLQAARDAVESVPTELWVDRRNSETIAQAIAPDFADLACAVASEHQAEIARLRKELAEVGDEAGRLAAQYQALSGIIDSLRVADDANAKAALLARLGEPDDELVDAVAKAMWKRTHDGEWPHDAESATEEIFRGDARSALAVITEKLK